MADDYEFAVLDLAPSLFLLALAALVAATGLITPVSATKLAVGGLGAFIGWTDDFRAEDLITARLLGVLATMVERRTRVAREMLDVLAGGGLPLFETAIPRRAAVEDQVGDRLVIGDAGAYPELAGAYHRFVDETLSRLGGADA